jgi:GNAT superfamily N-acetyltransferase
LPTSTALKAFAEAPGAFFPALGNEVVDDERFYVNVSYDRKWINACRLTFDPGDAHAVFAEIHALEPGAVASWITPRADLVEALRDAGARDPGPPLLPSFTALAIEQEPPAPADDIEVRRVESFDDFVVALELELSSENWTDEARAARRADLQETYRRRRELPGGAWLAFLDGRAVASAGAVACSAGLFLGGAATHPDARGRGCYRALIRARWDEAVRLGTPALVVHAQETSRPILESVGFERVCTMYELESGPLSAP